MEVGSIMACCLSISERGVIEGMVFRGDSFSLIARFLGRSCSTVYREVSRNGGRERYRADKAVRRAARKAKRVKQFKLLQYPDLADEVYHLLSVRKMSPPTIAEHLKQVSPDFRVCSETIYRACYGSATSVTNGKIVQRICLGLPDNSCDLLPRPKKRRRRHSTGPRGSHLGPFYKHISLRPDVGFGVWEGDLIVGASNRSFIATLVEQKTRYTILGEIKSKNSYELAAKLTELINRSGGVFKSITWDQGLEASKWGVVEEATGIQMYFASPRSPWQRGLNEQNNSVLRKWFPNKTDITTTQQELDNVAAELNSHPRKILKWTTPNQQMNKYTKHCIHQ